MKNPHCTHNCFIYEKDNIPDHRSRQFGCCPSLLAEIVVWLQTKSRIRAATQTRQMQNESNINKIRSALLSYHTSKYKTS